MSGAVPPPAARPLGRASRVPRPVCPGCGRCGRGDPAPAPQRAPLRAGVARCWGGGRASPAGAAFRGCEGRLWSGAPPPPTARPIGGLLGSATHVLWARVCGCGGPTVSPWPACPVGAACRGDGGGPFPGGLACHRCEGRLVSGAVPPPNARPLGGLLGSTTPVLWAPVCGCGGRTLSPWPACSVGAACRGGGGGPSPGGTACHRCEGRLVSGAVPPPAACPLGRAAGLPRPVCPGCGRCGRGDPAPAPQRAPLAGRRCSLWEWRKCVLGWCAFHRCEGRLRSGAPPSPTARPLAGLSRSATHVLWARVCGCGGPTLSPWPACPVGAACRGGGRGPSPGGMACHRCEGRLVSGAVPPPAARPLGRRPGFRDPCVPGAVVVGVGTQHRPHSVHSCRPALLSVGVAEGRPRGSWPATVVRGVCGQALPLPRLPAHWAGCWGPPTTCCGRGCVGVGARHCPLGLHALWGLHAV